MRCPNPNCHRVAANSLRRVDAGTRIVVVVDRSVDVSVECTSASGRPVVRPPSLSSRHFANLA
ncbi:hypothetical protein AKJ09_02559 [Labilithrix luteola]|uniref:Uncharacterized protein n=1 Tax=Labilithrix luteola TaxID=1391654 RepID=A0A0K1PQS4_9BACT|nr:hypothetical protein AKJ09_02559 [Labilithrix luteola]